MVFTIMNSYQKDLTVAMKKEIKIYEASSSP